MYADLHCHPAAVAYDETRMAEGGKDKLPFDPWHIPQSDLVHQAKATRPAKYSQCDFAKSTAGGATLMFAALHPVEKGFFSGINGGKMSKKMVTEFYRRLHIDGEEQAQEWLLEQVHSQPGQERLKKKELDFLQTRLLNFPLERIHFLQNGNYDYWEELKREYKFFRSKTGQPTATPRQLQLEQQRRKQYWTGQYQLLNCGKEVERELARGKEEITVILTIQGIHALGVGNPEDEGLREGETPKDISWGKLKSRIRQLKGEEALEDNELQRWEHRPFFITLANHFNNNICGHARSFTGPARLLFDQRKNMNKGVLRSSTYEIMQELLGLDTHLRPTGSKRILIDVKGMSAASRQDFYKNIIRPFNRKAENKEQLIPVIASHVGYSGIETLEEQIKNAQAGKEEGFFQVNHFNASNLNLTAEDVVEIHSSHGLIGLSFDRHVLGDMATPWYRSLPVASWQRKHAMNLFARTIEHIVRVPFEYNLEEPLRIWDNLSMGTDFDGFNVPLDCYPTVLHFKDFEADLVKIISTIKKQEPRWIGGYKPEALARKICFENAMAFVAHNY